MIVYTIFIFLNSILCENEHQSNGSIIDGRLVNVGSSRLFCTMGDQSQLDNDRSLKHLDPLLGARHPTTGCMNGTTGRLFCEKNKYLFLASPGILPILPLFSSFYFSLLHTPTKRKNKVNDSKIR